MVLAGLRYKLVIFQKKFVFKVFKKIYVEECLNRFLCIEYFSFLLYLRVFEVVF